MPVYRSRTRIHSIVGSKKNPCMSCSMLACQLLKQDMYESTFTYYAVSLLWPVIRDLNLVVLLLRTQVPNLPVEKALKLLRRRNCIKKQSLMFPVVSQLHCKWLEGKGLLIHRSRRRIQAVLFMCTVMYTEISKLSLSRVGHKECWLQGLWKTKRAWKGKVHLYVS